MQWHTLQQDWGKSRQGEEKGGYEGGRRSVVLGVHLETKEKRRKRGGGKRGRIGESGKQGGKTRCISPLPACAPAMPPCHAVA